MSRSINDILSELANEAPSMDIDIVDLSKPHLPTIILIDTSSSMAKEVDGASNISRVNDALRDFVDNVSHGSSEAYQRIRTHGDFCIITYGDDQVDVAVPWCHGSQLQHAAISPFSARGNTPMYSAILLAADMMLEILRSYNQNDCASFRGAVFNLTDGQPTDGENMEKAKMVVRMFETASSAKKALAEFHHVGVPGFNRAALNEIAIDPGRVNPIGATDMSAFFTFLQITFSGIAGDATSAAALAQWREAHGSE